MPSTDEILKKYSRIVEAQLGSSQREPYSHNYIRFKEEMIPKLTSYEKWAKSLGNLISIKVAEKDRIRIQKELDSAHLDVNASQVLTLALVTLFSVFLLTVLATVSAYLIMSKMQIQSLVPNLALFGFLGFLVSLFLFYYLYSMPKRLANAWRLRASSQMVPAILYVVVYMKHTPNLERAIEFASEHLEGPLALDFKKIFYDVETSKFSTIKQALDNYLETWREYAPEFIESFHLIESSLYEPSEARRIQILEKALQVILDGIYEKMLKYSRDIRTPLTNIYMLGIILPTLGLALLPLASTLLQGMLKWPHVFILFNIIIPFLVFYMTSEILFKRPGGYGESSVLEMNPNYQKFKSKKPWLIAASIAIPLIIISFLPFLFHSGLFGSADYKLENTGLSFLGTGCIFDFKSEDGFCGVGKGQGPFGTISVILSLLFPLAIALFFSIAYKAKTKDLIKSRENTKILEEEFTNSLFQLGNRLGDGIPAEIAFGKVAESTKGQITQNFFAIVNQNIAQSGMSLESAIFDKNRGALTYYPSSLIATSMKILIESTKKGLQIAAQSLMSISEYVKNISKINQRLRDLLAEIISDMKSNMTFLAPLLAGIVTGLATMITIILNKIQYFLDANQGGDLGSLSSFSGIMKIFDVSSMIPPYFLQIIIGLYIIEIVFILNQALVTVDSGKDPLREKYDLSRYLRTSIFLYLGTAFLATLLLSILAGFALQSGLGI